MACVLMTITNTRDIPKDIIVYFINGLADCSNKEFHDVCVAQKGFMSTPIYEQWVEQKGARNNPAALLEYFSTTLVSKYKSLLQGFKWVGADAKKSSFNASTSTDVTSTDGAIYKARHGSWVEWFDRQVCTVPGCNKNHPTKYHDDPGIRNRPFVPFKDRKQQTTRQSNGQFQRSGRPSYRNRLFSRPQSNQSRSPRFKSKDAKDKAMKVINNILLEHIADDDKDLLANIGEVEDEEPEIDLEIHNVSEETGDVSEGDEDDDDGMDAARALAAISLNKMLLN